MSLVMIMDELCLLLENVYNDVALLNREACFEAKKYGELLKPWSIKSAESNKLPAVEQNLTGSGDGIEQEYVQELDKVEDLLRKARLLRQPKEQKKPKSENGKPAKSIPPVKESKGRQICQQQPKLKAFKAQPLRKRRETSAASTKKMLNVLAQPDGKGKSTTQRIEISKSENAATSSFPKIEISTPPHLQLEQVLQQNIVSSKYKKLCNMHSKLQTNKRFHVGFKDLPSNAEMSFVSKLVTRNKVCGNLENISQTLLTSAATGDIAQSCIQSCQNLINTISYKLGNVESSHKNDLVRMHCQKVAYTQANALTVELEKCFDWITNKHVISLQCASETQQPALSLKNNDLMMYHMPCKYTTFEKGEETVVMVQYAHDLLWHKLSLFLKQKIYETFQDVLTGTVSVSEGCKVDKDFATCLTSTFGLLAKENRCSINPSVVL